MIAPERWQEYDRQYQKYGLNMAPETENRNERKQRRKNAQINRVAELTIGNDRKMMLVMVLIVMIALMFVVVMAAYTAKLTYDINNIKAENDVLIGEIEDMDVDMMSAGSISYIEKHAKSDLGMKNAGSKSTVYISSEDVPQEGFADIIKTKAYE